MASNNGTEHRQMCDSEKTHKEMIDNILELNEYKQIKSDVHKQIELGEDAFHYTSRSLDDLERKDIFNQILQNINPLNFSLIYNRGDRELIDYIEGLLDKAERGESLKERISAKMELKRYEPNEDSKISIVMDALLNICKKKCYGFGVSDSFPYYYNGAYWELITEESAMEFLVKVAEKYGYNYHDINPVTKAKKLYKQFERKSAIPAPKTEFPNIKINLKNGTFVINGESQELCEFRQEDLFKYQLSFDYEPEKKAPIFQKYLDRVLPEVESQMALAEYMGTIFLPGVKLEKCVVLIGKGANGKSLFYEVMRALLGEENICSYTLSNLCNESGYYRAKLSNKLLNYSSELGGKGCDNEIVKKMISNEPISARAPYGQPFELTRYCKFMFNANSLPKDTDHTPSYYRRFVYIRFGVKITKEEMDHSLHEKIIKSELSGVFNWIMEGLRRFIYQGGRLTESTTMTEEWNKAKEDSDSVALFMQETGYIPSATEHLKSTDLYSDYTTYCKEGGYWPVSRSEFLSRLDNLDYKVVRKMSGNATWVYCEVTSQNIEAYKETQDLVAKFAAGSINKQGE